MAEEAVGVAVEVAEVAEVLEVVEVAEVVFEEEQEAVQKAQAERLAAESGPGTDTKDSTASALKTSTSPRMSSHQSKIGLSRKTWS